MINVLVVDDHDLVRHGIKALLDDVKGIKVVGEAATGEEAIEIARKTNPNVILMDVKMPGMGGIEATRTLTRIMPSVKILAVSSFGEDPYPTRLLQAGARGYITKGARIDEMVRAIRAINAGQSYLVPEIAQKLAMKHLSHEVMPFDSLSGREMQVAMMITSGLKAQEIAESLHMSPKTVNSYRYRIFKKLGINSDVELTHLAIRHGLVEQ